MDENNIQVTNNDLLDALTKLNESSSATNKSIQELQAYFIAKDKKEAQQAETLNKMEKEADEEASKLEEQALKQEQSEKAEATAKADQQTETYTELLTEINEGIQLQNQLMVAQSIYIGIVVGLLFMKILFDRIFK